jgi:hypothetical protein
MLLGCKAKFTQFFMDYNSSATIPATTPIDVPFDIYTPDQTTNASYEFEVNDTRKDKIQKITLDDLKISITAPSEETFSFLKDISVYISADGLPEKQVAYKYDIDNSIGSTLECEETQEDLQAYVKADKFTVRLKTVTDEIITNDIEVNISTNFFVDAKLIN